MFLKFLLCEILKTFFLKIWFLHKTFLKTENFKWGSGGPSLKVFEELGLFLIIILNTLNFTLYLTMLQMVKIWKAGKIGKLEVPEVGVVQ